MRRQPHELALVTCIGLQMFQMLLNPTCAILVRQPHTIGRFRGRSEVHAELALEMADAVEEHVRRQEHARDSERRPRAG